MLRSFFFHLFFFYFFSLFCLGGGGGGWESQSSHCVSFISTAPSFMQPDLSWELNIACIRNLVCLGGRWLIAWFPMGGSRIF